MGKDWIKSRVRDRVLGQERETSFLSESDMFVKILAKLIFSISNDKIVSLTAANFISILTNFSSPVKVGQRPFDWH